MRKELNRGKKIKMLPKRRVKLFKMLFMRPIVFYQKRISKHTCLYEPTCSEYMKRSINNKGVFLGLLFGTWRLIRCNPLSKGGYDPAPEQGSKLKWVL